MQLPGMASCCFIYCFTDINGHEMFFFKEIFTAFQCCYCIHWIFTLVVNWWSTCEIVTILLNITELSSVSWLFLLVLSPDGLHSSSEIHFLQNNLFGIKWPTGVDMPLNKTQIQTQKSISFFLGFSGWFPVLQQTLVQLSPLCSMSSVFL